MEGKSKLCIFDISMHFNSAKLTHRGFHMFSTYLFKDNMKWWHEDTAV